MNQALPTVRIAAAQTAEYRDDIDAALACIAEMAARADAAGARLLCFPEAFLQGYLLDPAEAARVALDLASPEFAAVLARLPRTPATLVIGLIEREGDQLFNSAVVIADRQLVGRYRKNYLLPSEHFFTPGSASPLFEVDGLRFGINICFDTNFPDAARPIAEAGGALVVCLANNMLSRVKAEVFRNQHNAVRGERCRRTGLWLISADVTGERDGRIAWGPTAVLDPTGRVAAQLPLDAPGLLVFDLPVGATASIPASSPAHRATLSEFSA